MSEAGEFLDILTGCRIRDPARAADGHLYDFTSLTEYFAAREAAGLPIVSPRTSAQMARTLARDADARARLADLLEDMAMHDPGTHVKTLAALRSVFNLLDELGDMLSTLLNGWKTPVVMVLGNESSGKSSVLDRLAMMPLLPRGEETCTRMLIMLRMRHSDTPRLPLLRVIDLQSGVMLRQQTLTLVGGEVDVREQMNAVIREEHPQLDSVRPPLSTRFRGWLCSPTLPTRTDAPPSPPLPRRCAPPRCSSCTCTRLTCPPST